MPIYEFECSACNQIVEVIQKVSDPVPETCPSCKANGSLSKMISRSSFVLKGTGWYETDFKDKARSGKANTAASADSTKTSECSSGCSCCSGDSTAKTESTTPDTSSTKATGTDGK